MQRNEPAWSASVFAAGAFAGVLVVGAGIAKDWTAKSLLGLALVVFLYAAVAGTFFLIIARGDRPTPFVTASLSDGSGSATFVKGDVKVEQVASSETVDVFVGATIDPRPTDASVVDQLFEARMGASASGSIDLPLDVRVPDGYRFITVRAWVIRPDQTNDQRKACFPDHVDRAAIKDEPGCVIIRLP